MSSLTTHVLDTARGRPAQGLTIVLERQAPEGFVEIARGETDADGRVRELIDASRFSAGIWRLTFHTGAYLEAMGTPGFYPWVAVVFTVTQPEEHHHVPLLLSPHGYSTYRGS